ncbi:septum formation initiator family protein [Bacillus sp. 165]|uniref:FtsB family cell division protein n=1 Tax=Bacillus sp. 165 TaxID=1529117 RepID=UPI001ADD13D8|nr:septum formation initiator family protein [Bacillus sp. 165]MBO9131311.1 septum formation initiator family protein [Bacillus sp. 165]
MRELRKSYIPSGQYDRNDQNQHTIQSGQDRNKRLVRRLAVFLVFTLTIVVSLNVTFYKQEAEITAKKHERMKLQKELTSLKTDEQKLKDEIKKLNDDDYIAKIARRDYFFSKPGEIIFPISK